VREAASASRSSSSLPAAACCPWPVLAAGKLALEVPYFATWLVTGAFLAVGTSESGSAWEIVTSLLIDVVQAEEATLQIERPVITKWSRTLRDHCVADATFRPAPRAASVRDITRWRRYHPRSWRPQEFDSLSGHFADQRAPSLSAPAVLGGTRLLAIRPVADRRGRSLMVSGR
jgi:hypothetical protein